MARTYCASCTHVSALSSGCNHVVLCITNRRSKEVIVYGVRRLNHVANVLQECIHSTRHTLTIKACPRLLPLSCFANTLSRETERILTRQPVHMRQTRASENQVAAGRPSSAALALLWSCPHATDILHRRRCLVRGLATIDLHEGAP